MSGSRPNLVYLVVFAMVAALTILSTGAADAFDPKAGWIFCSDLDQARIGFASNSRWSYTSTGGAESGDTFQAQVDQGYDDWRNQIKDWQGGNALGNGGSTFTMWWVNLPSSTTYASTDCLSKQIDFNTDFELSYINGTINLRGVSTHEWGHVWGLMHSGRYDSHGAGEPSTSTCWGSTSMSNAWRITSQDDDAAIQYQTDKVTSGGKVWRSLTANSSWEDGWQHWGLQAVTNKYLGYPGQDGSTTHAVFKGSSSSTAVYSTSRLSGQTSPKNGYIQGRINYRKHSSSDTGYVKMVLKWRPVDYKTKWDAGCNFTGVSMNEVYAIGNFGDHYFTKICYPTSSSSWGWCSVSDPDPLDTSAPEPHFDGFDVRIVAYNNMRSTLSPERPRTYVRVDRVRALIDMPGSEN